MVAKRSKPISYINEGDISSFVNHSISQLCRVTINRCVWIHMGLTYAPPKCTKFLNRSYNILWAEVNIIPHIKPHLLEYISVVEYRRGMM